MDLHESVISFVKREKTQIEDATEDIRDRIRKARRNYEMRYDNPIDKSTGKRKVFVPLTKWEVDAIVPRFEIDPDSLFISTNEPGLERKAIIWQELLRKQFKDIRWSARFNALRIPWCNEGMFLIEAFWDNEKKRPDVIAHDIKDVYIFPKEDDILSSSAFSIKRRILIEDFMNSSRYTNKELVSGGTTVSDGTSSQSFLKDEIGVSEYNTSLDYVEVYERHGFFPKSFITENPDDSKKLIDGTISIAWIDSKPVLVELSEESYREYFVDCWYIRRPYSWYGFGVGLALLDYQFQYNKMVNRRDDNEDILHRGMFLKQRGMNIDARQRVTGSGVIIEVDDVNGFQQLKTNDITQTSYIGEQNLLQSVERLDGTFEIIRGGGSANSASEAAIKDRNAGTRLSSPQSYLTDAFRRLVRCFMKLDQKYLPKGTVVKLTGRDEDLAVFDDFKLEEVNKARSQEGLPPVSREEFMNAMKKFGGQRFLEVPSMKFLSGDFDPDIDVDASLIKSKAGQAQFIVDAMKIAAQVPGVPQTLDFADMFETVLNLNGIKVKRNPTPMGMGAGIEGGAPPTNTNPEVQQALAGNGGQPTRAVAG